MSNIEIIELQNAIISNMAQINTELYAQLEQYEAVAQNNNTEQLEAENNKMLERLRIAGIIEEGGSP